MLKYVVNTVWSFTDDFVRLFRIAVQYPWQILLALVSVWVIHRIFRYMGFGQRRSILLSEPYLDGTYYQAMLHAGAADPHQFYHQEVGLLMRPAYCNVCAQRMFGVSERALCCDVCGVATHERCVAFVEHNCKSIALFPTPRHAAVFATAVTAVRRQPAAFPALVNINTSATASSRAASPARLAAPACSITSAAACAAAALDSEVAGATEAAVVALATPAEYAAGFLQALTPASMATAAARPRKIVGTITTHVLAADSPAAAAAAAAGGPSRAIEALSALFDAVLSARGGAVADAWPAAELEALRRHANANNIIHSNTKTDAAKDSDVASDAGEEKSEATLRTRARTRAPSKPRAQSRSAPSQSRARAQAEADVENEAKVAPRQRKTAAAAAAEFEAETAAEAASAAAAAVPGRRTRTRAAAAGAETEAAAAAVASKAEAGARKSKSKSARGRSRSPAAAAESDAEANASAAEAESEPVSVAVHSKIRSTKAAKSNNTDTAAHSAAETATATAPAVDVTGATPSCASSNCSNATVAPQPHHWVRGNHSTVSDVCLVCGEVTGSLFALAGLHCLWCRAHVHEDCVG